MPAFRSFYASSPLHPDTLTWQRRVNEANGSIAKKTLMYTDRLIKYCYAVGLRDPAGLNHKQKFWLPLATDTFDGLFIPIWHPTPNAVCTNNNFVAADYSLSNGLQGNGVDKYVDSLINTSLFTNSIYLAAHSSTDNLSSSYAIAAGNLATPVISSLIFRWTNGLSYFDYGDVNSIFETPPSSLGLFAGFRTAGQNYLYQNETQLATNAAVANPPTLPPLNFYLFACNDNGALFGISDRRLCCFFIGDNVTPALHEGFALQSNIWHTSVRN